MRTDVKGDIWQVARFEDVEVGGIFQNGGNKWRKRSSRTAVIISPERYAWTWFYFNRHETVEIRLVSAGVMA